MGIKEICEPWEDVFDASLDEHLAPELGDLLSEEESIYADAYRFFSRTYITDSIMESLENIISILKGEGGNNTFTIYSLFGGGKTHTLFAIYHAMKKPEILMHEDILKGHEETKKKRIIQIAEDIKKLKDIQIVVIYGKDYKYCGRPSAPIEVTNYKIYTVWGYLAHSLGRYDYIRNDDEKLTVPDISTLRKVLGDKPTIILIDEIVDYAYGLRGSKIKEEKEYVDSIPQFLDRLTSAVVGTKTAVVVSLPIEVKGENIEKTETWYEKDFVRKYWTALHRTAAKDRPALKIRTDEIIDVIKKRNFKTIDERLSEIIIKDFERIYKQNREEVFGGYEDTIAKMRITFPYHPDLIEILREIIEKAELQRTRDMLKITRRIIRLIWNSNDNPYAIMPWHIDVTLDMFHAEFFARSGLLADYAGVVRKDIVENAEKFDNPELTRKIASVIFLKTYIYDSPTPQPNFPSTFDIAKMVYEQEFFMKNKLGATAIIDTLEQMENRAYMYHLQIKDGRYWFWKIASVKEQIESEARKLVDEEKEMVESKIAEMVEKLVKGETSTKKRKRRKITGIRVLNENAIHVTRKTDIDIEDNSTYKTIFLVNGNVTKEDCERIMFNYRDSERTYKNTIICVYPYSNEEYGKCMHYAASVLACENISEELPQLYPDAGEEVLKVQKSIVEKIHDTAEDDLIRQIFRTFKNVAYPSTKKDKTRPKIEIIEAPEGASTLLEQTYLALVSPQVAKILDSLSFDSLKREINDVLEIDIEIDSSKKILDIKNWFKTNPAFPMVEDSDIEEAIIDGIKELSIGVSNEDIFYKRVYTEDVDFEVDIGNAPKALKDDYKIIPWKEAILQQVNNLIKEKRSAKENIRIEYELKYENSIYPLEKLMEQEDWEEIVRQGFIIRKVEKITLPKKDFRIEITPDSVTGKKGDKLEIKVRIEPVGNDDIFVKVRPDLGDIKPSEGKLPLECKWELEIPSERGMRSVEIKVESDEQRKSEFLLLNIESDIISTSEISEEHIGMNLFEIRKIKSVELLRELDTLTEKNPIISGDLKSKEESKGIGLSIRNMESDVVYYIISQIKEVIEGEITTDLTAYIQEEEGIKIDELTFHKISSYNGKAEFRLKRGK